MDMTEGSTSCIGLIKLSRRKSADISTGLPVDTIQRVPVVAENTDPDFYAFQKQPRLMIEFQKGMSE
jgi:hypothetical protein